MRFAEVMGLMGANVEWSPYSITITGAHMVDAGCLDVLVAADVTMQYLSPPQ